MIPCKSQLISVIIPVLNEGECLSNTLKRLSLSAACDVTVVDGGSSDKTVDIAEEQRVKVVFSEKGRARQMNCGAKEARGDILVFLHADTYFKEDPFPEIKDAIAKGFIGGCLSQKIDSARFIYRLIEASGNIRARILKIFYGDQAIFVRKDVFAELGGFEGVDLLEDVIFSRKMRKKGKVRVLNKKVYASPRRWEKQGIMKTTFINWVISFSFIFGVSPDKLRRFYYDIR